MSGIRAFIRLTLIVILSVLLILLHAIVGVLIWPFGASEVRWRRRVVRWGGTGVARILGLTIDVSGPIPHPPFCMVSNHLSYMDAIVFQALTGSVLIANSDVGSWPLIGRLAGRMGTIFIDRTSPKDSLRVSSVMETYLEQGESIVFFPEGTSSGGQQVEKFHSSLLNQLASSAFPVHYAALSYSSPYVDASQAICWWGGMLFAPHVWGLLKIKSFRCQITFGNQPIVGTNRRELTNSLRDHIVDLFQPTDRLDPAASARTT